MANSVRAFVIESLKGFYKKLPLKNVAIDGSVLTPDASGVVNLNVVTSDQLEEVELSTAMALNDVSAKIDDSSFKISVLAENLDYIRLDITDLSTSISYIDSSIAIIDASVSVLDASVKLIDTSVKRIDTSVKRIDTSVRDMSTYIADISTRIDDNELIVASALSDLDSRIEDVSSRIVGGDGNADLMTSVTYAELKTLRDSSSLVPGMRYRITDYECITTQSDTSVAGHIFDIIVTADSSIALNENAKATWHEGDTYFQNADLDSWQLKYTLDNDVHKFEWAYNIATSITDTSSNTWDKSTSTTRLYWGKETTPKTNVKGYVYLYGHIISGGGITTFYGCTSPNPQPGDYIYKFTCTTSTFPNNINQYNTNTKVSIYGTVDSAEYDYGKGIIYWMKDEFNNEAPYDFKNILYKYTWQSYEWDDQTEAEITVNHESYIYTFTYFAQDSTAEDYSVPDKTRNSSSYTSIYVPASCHDIVIKARMITDYMHRDDHYFTLPHNIVWSDSGYYNHASNIFIGENSYRNIVTGTNHIIENGCHSNLIGENYYGTSIGGGLNNITIHHGCSDLKIDGAGNNLTFMPGCSGLTLHTGGGDWFIIRNCTIYPNSNRYNAIIRSDTYSVDFEEETDSSIAVDGEIYEDALLINGFAYYVERVKKIDYASLKYVRDREALAPGQQYYIYDYVTTVGDASLSSAMHPFGIIVTANSPSELDENARICNVEDDEYYTNLDAYEIKYCIDNDSSRFGWADPNGTGVIYYMKDNNRNEAYYDFTNILFDNKYTFDYNGTDARLDASANIHDNVIGPHYGGYASAGSQQTYYTLSPNNIVFEGLMNYNNTFGNDCYDLKFANQTMFNTFDGGVWDCSFGTLTIYNHFGSYITGNIFPANLATSDIGSNTWYVNVLGTTSYIRCRIMPNTKGTSTSSRLSISITETGQHAGLNSSGVLKKWLPADLID